MSIIMSIIILEMEISLSTFWEKGWKAIWIKVVDMIFYASEILQKVFLHDV